MKQILTRYTMGDGIRAVLAVLLGVVPLSFSTVASQLVESTGILLSYGLIGVVIVLMLIDLARAKTYALRFSLFDGLVCAGLGASLLASLFGVDIYQSIAGYQLVMTTSWISVSAAVFVYFAIRLYVSERQHVMLLLTATAVGLSVMSMLQVVGRFVQLPVAFFSGSFDTIGLGAALASGLWVLVMLVGERTWFKRLSSVAWVVSVACVVLMNNIVGLLATVIFTFCFILGLSSQAAVLRKGFMWLMTGYMAIMTLVIAFPVMSSIGIPRTIDLTLPLSQTAQVVKDVLTHDLMLGVGPQNFAYAVHAYKPEALNLSLAWNIGFTKAGSTAFELLATVGLIGFGVVIAAVIVFVMRGVRLVRAARTSTTLHELKGMVLAAGIVSIGIMLMLLSLLTSFEWYLIVYAFVIFALVAQMTEERRGIARTLPLPIVHAVVYAGVVVLLIAGYYGGRWHAGSAYLYQQYASAAEARAGLERALTLNERQAETWIMHANVVMSELPSVEDARTAQRSHEAIMSDYTKALIYAGDRASIYQALRSSMLTYAQQGGSVSTELETVTQRLKELDPHNPQLFMEEGQRYQAYAQRFAGTGQGDPQPLIALAEDQFLRALELKPNYLQGYYALGNFYETMQGEYEKAEQQYLRALVIDPLSRETLIALLDVMVYRTNKVEDALTLLERYLQDNPDDSMLLLHQEEYLLYTERDEEAAAVTQRIEELGIERPQPIEHTHDDGTTHAHIVE